MVVVAVGMLITWTQRSHEVNKKTVGHCSFCAVPEPPL